MHRFRVPVFSGDPRCRTGRSGAGRRFVVDGGRVGRNHETHGFQHQSDGFSGRCSGINPFCEIHRILRNQPINQFCHLPFNHLLGVAVLAEAQSSVVQELLL